MIIKSKEVVRRSELGKQFSDFLWYITDYPHNMYFPVDLSFTEFQYYASHHFSYCVSHYPYDICSLNSLHKLFLLHHKFFSEFAFQVWEYIYILKNINNTIIKRISYCHFYQYVRCSTITILGYITFIHFCYVKYHLFIFLRNLNNGFIQSSELKDFNPQLQIF